MTESCIGTCGRLLETVDVDLAGKAWCGACWAWVGDCAVAPLSESAHAEFTRIIDGPEPEQAAIARYIDDPPRYVRHYVEAP